MSEILIGEVNHYFSKIGVAGLNIREPLRIGDHIHILGHTTDLEQSIVSMQINHKNITHAEPGDNVAITVPKRVRAGDKVYLRVYGRTVFQEEDFREPALV